MTMTFFQKRSNGRHLGIGRKTTQTSSHPPLPLAHVTEALTHAAKARLAAIPEMAKEHPHGQKKPHEGTGASAAPCVTGTTADPATIPQSDAEGTSSRASRLYEKASALSTAHDQAAAEAEATESMLCEAEKALEWARQERDAAMRDAEASHAGITDALTHWVDETEKAALAATAARSEAKARHEEILAMLHASETEAKSQQHQAQQHEKAIAKASMFGNILEGMRNAPDGRHDTTSTETPPRSPATGADLLDERQKQTLSKINALRRDATQAETLERDASIAYRKAESEMEDATAAVRNARMVLMEARHRQDLAGEDAFRTNQAVHEGSIGRQSMTEAAEHLDTIARETYEGAMEGLSKAEDAVRRLREEFANQPESAEGISDLLRAAEWDLQRAKGYAEFTSRLTSMSDDMSHTDIRTLYQESDPEAFIVTADRDAALRRYADTYADTVRMREMAMGDDEYEQLIMSRDKAREALLIANQEIADAQASLDDTYISENAAWDRLNEATRELVLRDNETTRLKASLTEMLDSAINEAMADIEAARRDGYRQSLVHRDAVDRLDDMKELAATAHLTERQLAEREEEQTNIASKAEKLAKAIHAYTPDSYLSDPRTTYDRMVIDGTDTMGHETLLADMTKVYATLMERETKLTHAKQSYEKALAAHDKARQREAASMASYVSKMIQADTVQQEESGEEPSTSPRTIKAPSDEIPHTEVTTPPAPKGETDTTPARIDDAEKGEMRQ